MSIATYLHQIVDNQLLTETECSDLFQQILSGQVDDMTLSAIVTALRMRGETHTEIFAAAKVLRHKMTAVAIQTNKAIDIVGTGGDGANLFNVSTASAFVTCASGVTVAKHGNYGVSSHSGSANILESLGINIQRNAEQVANCIDLVGMGFMFAPMFHSAMRYVAPVRKALKMRTIFNLLGPLCNPANVNHYLLGVYDNKWLLPIANALLQLGCSRAMVVHSHDGLDEISVVSPTNAIAIADGKLQQLVINPTDYGFNYSNLAPIQVDSIERSKQMLLDSLAGKQQQATDMVLLNSGVAIYLAGHSKDIGGGIAMAEDAIASGLALEKVKELQQATQVQ